MAALWRRRPHVALLGAGASRAAFPDGDKNGRKLPVIVDFIEVVGLGPLLSEMGVDYEGKNIEEVYASLGETGHPRLGELEDAISSYFNQLELPDEPTLYDYIVLSLNRNDLIATFNWDPFLIQAARRNYAGSGEPQFAFLHGNAWVGYCERDDIVGTNRTRCSRCGNVFTPSRLLYPIRHKDYASDPFIRRAWDQFRDYLHAAAVFTIFGYGAPASDKEAVEAIKGAWGTPDERPFEQIEIVDIRDEDELRDAWAALIHTHHYDVVRNYFDSWIAHHPARTIDRYVAQFLEAQFIDYEPAPQDVDLETLQSWFSERRR